ncbi:unnamed protein product, partial [Effrenium voratum]
EATLAAELEALHGRLLSEHRKELKKHSWRDDEVQSALGPKLSRLSGQGVHGDISLDPDETTVPTESSYSDIVDRLMVGDSLKAAAEGNSVSEKWLLLSLGLWEVQVPGFKKAASALSVEKEKEDFVPAAMIMHPIWNRSLSTTRQTRRHQRRTSIIRQVSRASRMNEKLLDDTCLQPFIMSPLNPERIAWTAVGFVLIIWDMITIPMQLFDIPGFSGFLELMGKVTFGYWLLDCLLQFIFSVERQGQLEMRPRVLARLYLKSWFPLDIMVLLIDVVLFTLEAVLRDEGAVDGLKSVRLLRGMRMLRLLRLLRVGKLKQAFAVITRRFTSLYFVMISKVLSGLGMILVANHFIACFWYGLGLLYLEEGSWLLLAGIEEADFGLGYVAAMHWSLTQFTPATNNISPVTPLERLFAVVVILIAMGVFSSFISSITSAVNTLRAVRMEQLKQANVAPQ